MKQLKNKNGIVTGAGRGIGLAIANALVEEGARGTGWNRIMADVEVRPLKPGG